MEKIEILEHSVGAELVTLLEENLIAQVSQALHLRQLQAKIYAIIRSIIKHLYSVFHLLWETPERLLIAYFKYENTRFARVDLGMCLEGAHAYYSTNALRTKSLRSIRYAMAAELIKKLQKYGAFFSPS